MSKNAPKEGDLKVYNIKNIPNPPEHYPVKTPKHGAMLIELLAESQLLDETIESNTFGLLVFKDGDWENWEDENGYSIQEYAHEQGWDKLTNLTE